MPTNPPEFVFVDESGDPGRGEGTAERFYLAAVHCSEPTVRIIRQHLVNLRYHHGLGGGELKDWWPVRKGDVGERRLQSCVRLLDKLTTHGELKGTAVWVDKDRWATDGGPYSGTGEDSFKFRNYVLKRLLRRHVARYKWGDNVDLVIDRYDLPDREFDRLRNLLSASLDPKPAHITPVSSAYVGVVQIADLYTKLVKQSLGAEATTELVTLCETLMSPREVRWGVRK
jgi:Protein of unknown function (DUF3800)